MGGGGGEGQNLEKVSKVNKLISKIVGWGGSLKNPKLKTVKNCPVYFRCNPLIGLLMILQFLKVSQIFVYVKVFSKSMSLIFQDIFRPSFTSVLFGDTPLLCMF